MAVGPECRDNTSFLHRGKLCKKLGLLDTLFELLIIKVLYVATKQELVNVDTHLLADGGSNAFVIAGKYLDLHASLVELGNCLAGALFWRIQEGQVANKHHVTLIVYAKLADASRIALLSNANHAHTVDVFQRCLSHILLQILDEGRLTDGQGRHVDFSNTVVIMTSNIGAREIAKTNTMGFSAEGSGGLSDKEISHRVRSELKRSFRPEFLNRVDDIVVFKSLTAKQLRGIVDLMVLELRDRLIANGMSIDLTDAARDLIAKNGTDPVYGARPLRRAIQSMIEDPLSEELLEGKWQSGDIVLVDIDDENQKLTFKSLTSVFEMGTGVSS